MDVKTSFLNEFLKKDFYVAQSKGFINLHFSDHVLYLKKAFYGLKQMISSQNTWGHMGSQEEKLIKLFSQRGKTASW